MVLTWARRSVTKEKRILVAVAEGHKSRWARPRSAGAALLSAERDRRFSFFPKMSWMRQIPVCRASFAMAVLIPPRRGGCPTTRPFVSDQVTPKRYSPETTGPPQRRRRSILPFPQEVSCPSPGRTPKDAHSVMNLTRGSWCRRHCGPQPPCPASDPCQSPIQGPWRGASYHIDQRSAQEWQTTTRSHSSRRSATRFLLRV